MAECKHGLDTAWCASCKEPLRPSTRSAHEVGPPFRAQYEGICPECEGDIHPGARVRMMDNRCTHSECVPA